MAITFLGTSGAWPTPRPGCGCPQCAEARQSPRFARSRSSLLIETEAEVVLVDPGPDVWRQFEREGLAPHVDRVLVTHTHVDHILGLDDLVWLRADRRERPLVVHAAPYHQERVRAVFGHLIRDDRPRIALDDWAPGSRRTVGDVALEGVETGHSATFPTTAPLITLPDSRRVLYATDMGEMPPESRARLRGIDLLVGDASFLGASGHGHPGTDAVLALGAELEVGRVAFTHVGHLQLADADLRAHLGPDVSLAYDGSDLLHLLGT